MAKASVDELIGSIKEGIAEVPEKARDVAAEVADKVEEALENASAEGKRLTRRVQKELARRWRVVDKAGRENAFIMAAGALAVGVLVGYLIARDRD